MAEDSATAGPGCSANQRRARLAIVVVVCAWLAVAPPRPATVAPDTATDGSDHFERFTPAALLMELEPWETAVRDRAYLAGSSDTQFPASVTGADGSFPAFFRADARLAGAGAAEAARVSRRFIDTQLDLHGAVVLRGCGGNIALNKPTSQPTNHVHTSLHATPLHTPLHTHTTPHHRTIPPHPTPHHPAPPHTNHTVRRPLLGARVCRMPDDACNPMSIRCHGQFTSFVFSAWALFTELRLAVTGPGSFSTLLTDMGFNLTRYVGGVTHRFETAPLVYPASNEDPQVSMDLHQDNVYWPSPPAKLFFYYEQPAAAGGTVPPPMRGPLPCAPPPSMRCHMWWRRARLRATFACCRAVRVHRLLWLDRCV